MVTLTGKFIYEDNTPVANGVLVLTLSQPAAISGTGQVVPLVKVIQLDVNGNIPGGTTVYGNDVLIPSGTSYVASLYTGVLNSATGLYSTGAQLFNQNWSLTGSSVDVSTLTPSTVGVSYPNPITSVGLTMPGEFVVTGSPLTAAGTIAVTKANQNANQVFAGPTSGGAASPVFRALVDADVPGSLSAAGTMKNKTLQGANSGNSVNLLNAQGQLANVTGNSAAQLFFSFSLPANTLQTGKVLRLRAYVFHITGTAAVTYGCSIGGTVNTLPAAAAANGQTVMLQADIYCISSSSCLLCLSQNIGLGATTPQFNYGATNSLAAVFTGALTIGFTFNVANTDAVRPDMFVVELVQ